MDDSRFRVIRHTGGENCLMKDWEIVPALLLYTTSGCHLCEQAESLIQQVAGIAFRAVEIADDAELLERYGVRIPVLCRLESGEQLDWPFDAAAIRRLLAGRRLQP
jgi:hypothetical protein